MINERTNSLFYQFGTAAYYNSAAAPIKVIIEKDSGEFYGGSTPTRSTEITALCKTSDLTNIAANKTLKVGSVTYYITDYEVQENENLTLCYLSRSQV